MSLILSSTSPPFQALGFNLNTAFNSCGTRTKTRCLLTTCTTQDKAYILTALSGKGK